MRQFYTLLLLFALTLSSNAQGVGIGTTAPDASAQLDITSTSKGMLVPRVTSVQRKAIANPALGLLVFDTDKSTFYLFDGVGWKGMIFGSDADIPPIQRLPTDGTRYFAIYGASVAISGNYAMGGSPFAINDAPASIGIGYGQVYVFGKAGNWAQTQNLYASDHIASQHDHFGYSIAMSGGLAVIGAPGATIAGNDYQGAVYIFTLSGGTWNQTQKLLVAGHANDYFGYCVSTDGNTIAVGAPGTQVGGIGTGAVYTYTPNPLAGTGQPWLLQSTINNPGAAAGDSLGSFVHVSNSTLVAGAPGANNNTGYAGVYGLSGGSFVLQQLITDPAATAGDRFGASGCIDTHGAIRIGSPGFGQGASGYIYSYQLNAGGTYSSFAGPEPGDTPYSGGGAFLGATNDGDVITSYYEAGTGLRVFQGFGRWNQLPYIIKASCYPTLYPLAEDGGTVFYLTDSGYYFKNLQ